LPRLCWASKRYLYTSFTGYILGGGLSSYISRWLGLKAVVSSGGLPEFEFLKNLGLVIFFFEAGLSIGIDNLLGSFRRVLVIELVSYPVIWVLAKALAGFAGLGHLARHSCFSH